MTTEDALRALAGGVLIGAAASALLLFDGRLAGISNIAGGVVSRPDAETPWRVSFLAGLLAGGVLLLRVLPDAFPAHVTSSFAAAALAGLLVGLGTATSNGCTSGHGVCGLSRRSVRSLAATLVFMATGAATVFAVRSLGGR